MPSTSDSPRTLRHLAIVMDGNGRWAEKRHRPRSFGHSSGQKAVRNAVEFCLRNKIEALTLFAFSSENWRRPATEVKALMQLFLKALDKEMAELHKQHVRVAFIGDLSAFEPSLRERMQSAMHKTRHNAALSLNVAVNYGGRWDIAHAARQLAEAVGRGELSAEDIDETLLATRMCLADQPPPDLLIRTGGDYRISNFLLWQIAYTELYFTDTLWPDVDTDCLTRAMDDFASRQRRFGRTGSQVLAAVASH
ncbi:MAG TPA: polyprenyl diphosphate synthase [Oleiagrimonas sp.]|nr:polyprenyl diphosphate synthase [Oleiagrimonas sp.]